jgi:hypothetical protein
MNASTLVTSVSCLALALLLGTSPLASLQAAIILSEAHSSLRRVAEKQDCVRQETDSSLHCVTFGMTVDLLEGVGGGGGGGRAAAFSSPYMTTKGTVIPTEGRNLTLGEIIVPIRREE